MNRQSWIRSSLLLAVVGACAIGLGMWKYASIQNTHVASANQPEPMEVVMVAVARELEHRQTTTSIGTVLALRSITLSNEVAGTVRHTRLIPGQIVEAGSVLVELDVSVEEAERKAQEAQAVLAKTVLKRRQNLREDLATTQEEVDRAQADLQDWHWLRSREPRRSSHVKRSGRRSARGWAWRTCIPASTSTRERS